MNNLTSVDSMEGWKEITKSIGIFLSLKSDGTYHKAFYNHIRICQVRYDGKIVWESREHWKKDWEFKVTYSDEGFIEFWKKK